MNVYQHRNDYYFSRVLAPADPVCALPAETGSLPLAMLPLAMLPLAMLPLAMLPLAMLPLAMLVVKLAWVLHMPTRFVAMPCGERVIRNAGESAGRGIDIDAVLAMTKY